jgi:hypothetical protein
MIKVFSIKEYNCKEDYSIEFSRIAKIILNCVDLVTLKNSYLIREIEFYYYSAYHTDYYCHKVPRQQLNSRFYFHRFKDPDKYVNLKRKGLDITIGNNNEIYGGILIRAIQNKKTGEIYNGIGNLTNLIINEIGGTSEIEKIYKLEIDVFNNNSCLFLSSSSDKGFRIFKKQRQGLNLISKDTDRFYIDSKYNYFTYLILRTVFNKCILIN